jgi:serine/threonine protein kinase/Tol biopolymer transport system component
MALSSGTLLGPYEIQSPLGAGGMGEVYRARDTRLNRTVAVKILPSHLSSNPEAQQRFDREARAISSLSHPNVCQLYDVGSQDGTSFLVMEYLEGETLADRLRKGPLPLDQVLKYALEICEGLEKAHRSGVIHRDLKPGNIMLTKSGAKLLDFGLAKPALPASPPSSGLTQTIAAPQHPLTTEGMIVGTFQYMSPEQIEGREADARSDIFAFGAVLYEMVTGHCAFEGKTTASTIAAILAAEPPPISSVRPLSPLTLETTVKSCLAKDPDERVQTVHDVKLQLKWVAESASSSRLPAVAPISSRASNRVVWLVTGALALLLLAGAVVWWLNLRPPARAMYFNSSVTLPANNIALSPDGRTLALVAYWDQTSKYVLWTHPIGGRGATPIPGTEDAAHPFWSPDGRSIAFFALGKLKKVELASGGSAQVLCDAPHGRGGTWNRDGIILFAPDFFSGLYRLSVAGGPPVEVTKTDPARLESSHRWPVFLPDGHHFLYLAGNFSGHFENNEIFLGSLDSTEKRPVVSASSNVAYAEPGYLLYMRDTSLVAQKFDVHSYVLSGEPHTISDEVQYFPQTDLALFGVAGSSTLVLQTGKGADKNQLTWFDRTGKISGAIGAPGGFANPSISPDGRRLAFEQTDRDGRHVDIWIHEFASNATSRLTFGPGLNEIPLWSPDGKRINFGAQRSVIFNLYDKNVDGSGLEREVADLNAQEQGNWGWSADGKFILVRKDTEMWYLSVPDFQAKPFLQPKWIVRNGQFSPDGKWVAYSSNETGTWEVNVSSFPSAAGKWQVSRGGAEPRWRRDGKELFYLSADGKMMAVPVKIGASFEAGQPVELFQTHIRQPISAQDVFSYDVAADGQKFLINTKVDTTNSAPLSVILNWSSELEK